MRVRVETPARLHFGFVSLSDSGARVYGGVGVGIDRPRAVVEAEAAPTVEASHDDAVVRRAVDILGVEGACVEFGGRLPRHVGLGSGTQHALAVLHAVGRAHNVGVERHHAREMGRGIRSGVGVGVFEDGGLVVDAGHRTDTDADKRGVPSVVARHRLPSDWRFVVALPEGIGAHGDDEDGRMETVVGNDGTRADETARTVLTRLLPAVADDDIEAFGNAVERLGRANGEAYAEARGQEGRYADASKRTVETFRDHPDVAGAGQSSWGPAAYAVTTRETADHVAGAVDTQTFVAAPDDHGARFSRRV